MKTQRAAGALMFMLGITAAAFNGTWFIPVAGFGLLLFVEAVVIIGRDEQ